MENEFIYNPERYEPTNESYNDMIVAGIKAACKAGRLPRDV